MTEATIHRELIETKIILC